MSKSNKIKTFLVFIGDNIKYSVFSSVKLRCLSQSDTFVSAMNKSRPYFAIVSGLCASSASFFGKLSSLGQQLAENVGNKEFELLAQILCIGIMVLLNACVWRFFVKALHTNGGTLVASLVSAATNYTVSALLGWLIFNEKTTILWWFGTALVLGGLLLIVNDDEEDKAKKKKT